MLLRAPKWGNDDDKVDDIMKDLWSWTAKTITGETNAWGCHTCKTNCPKWDLKNNEYHCHKDQMKTAKLNAKKKAKNDIYCKADIYNCSDFSSQEEAQLVYDQCFKKVKADVHGLQTGGIVCDDLN